MNRKNVQELYNRLQILQDQDRQRRFYMADYIRPARLPDGKQTKRITADPFECGAAGCLAGWAAMIAHEQDPSSYSLEWIKRSAHQAGQRWLGLTMEQADHWFIGGWHPQIELREITLDHALVFLAKVLRGRQVQVTLSNEELADG